VRHVTHLQSVSGSGSAEQREPAQGCTDAEPQRAATRADVVLGAAGHQVTDEQTRELGRRVAADTASGDEAAARISSRSCELPTQEVQPLTPTVASAVQPRSPFRCRSRARDAAYRSYLASGATGRADV